MSSERQATSVATQQLPQILARLKELNKRLTPQRLQILEVVVSSKEHLDIEQIRKRVSELGAPISYATIYRTLRMLVDLGVIQERHFTVGGARYEYEVEHHDHLICTSCGRVTEFTNDAIEKLQATVVHEHGYTMTGHKHEIYGLCSECL